MIPYSCVRCVHYFLFCFFLQYIVFRSCVATAAATAAAAAAPAASTRAHEQRESALLPFF